MEAPGAEGLSGRTALVTGAGARLGRCLAEALAERGCQVVLHAHRRFREARALAARLNRRGRGAAALRADLSLPRAAEELARAAWRTFGGLDFLINSAAIFHPTPPQRLKARELNAFLALNLRAPFVLSSELGRRMKRRGRGAIVNLACVSGLRPWPGYLPYSVSKAGLLSLTAGLARLLAPEVRVNAVAPGPVLLPEGTSRAEAERLRRRLPLRRLGRPEDVVRAVLFLLASDFITGQVLCVDGGRSLV